MISVTPASRITSFITTCRTSHTILIARHPDRRTMNPSGMASNNPFRRAASPNPPASSSFENRATMSRNPFLDPPANTSSQKASQDQASKMADDIFVSVFPFFLFATHAQCQECAMLSTPYSRPRTASPAFVVALPDTRYYSLQNAVCSKNRRIPYI